MLFAGFGAVRTVPGVYATPEASARGCRLETLLAEDEERMVATGALSPFFKGGKV